MPMVPTDQIIDLQASGRRDVQCVGLTSSRQYTCCNVGEAEFLNGVADRMNGWLRFIEEAQDLLGLLLGSLFDFRQHDVGDQALPADTVKKAKQPMHHLRSIAWLARGETSPDARFEIEGERTNFYRSFSARNRVR